MGGTSSHPVAPQPRSPGCSRLVPPQRPPQPPRAVTSLSQHLGAGEGAELVSLGLEEARPCIQRVAAESRAGGGGIYGEKEEGCKAGKAEKGGTEGRKRGGG